MTNTSRPSSSARRSSASSGSASRPRRGGFLRWLLLGLVLMPIIEIVVLIMVGRAIGLWWTLGLIVVLAFVGTWLAKRESGRTYRALQKALDSGRMPANEMTDAILLMVGGVLLLLPGFVTDVFALMLVLPFTRPLARRLLQAVVASRVVVAAERAGATGPMGQGSMSHGPSAGRGSGASRGGQVIDGEIISDDPAPGDSAHQPPTSSLDR